jgi:uncharacterized membrane protein YfcA
LTLIVIELLLLSFGAGLIGALFGLGGGVFVVPALTLWFHLPIQVAIGASLISVVATSAGASVAFVREGWTNLRVAMVLEVATVTGALIGASLAGVISARVLEALFAAAMLVSVHGMLNRKVYETAVADSSPLARKLGLDGTYPDAKGNPVHYGVRRIGKGASLMMVAGVVSGMLGIGAGVLKVLAMDRIMGLPLKVSSATSNFMIGVTAGAGALVFLSRGEVSTIIAAPVALGITSGAIVGSRVLAVANVRTLRIVFVFIVLFIAAQMAFRAAGGG